MSARQQLVEEDSEEQIHLEEEHDYVAELKASRGYTSKIKQIFFWKPSIFTMPFFVFIAWNVVLLIAFGITKALDSTLPRLNSLHIYNIILFAFFSFNILVIASSLTKIAVRLVQFFTSNQKVVYYTSGIHLPFAFMCWVIFIYLTGLSVIKGEHMSKLGKRMFFLVHDFCLVIGFAWLGKFYVVKLIVEYVRYEEMESIMIREHILEVVAKYTVNSHSSTSALFKSFYHYIGETEEAAYQQALEFHSNPEVLEAASRFFNRYSQRKGYFDFNDIEFLFAPGDKKYAAKLKKFFRQSKVGEITEDDFTHSLRRMHEKQVNRIQNIDNTYDISGVLSRTVGNIVWFIAFVVCLIVAGVDVQALLLPFGTFFLSGTFIFGSSLSGAFQSLIFLLFVDAYDVGDVVILDGTKVIINQINLLTTIATTVDGRHMTYQNSKIAGSHIENLTKSEDWTFSWTCKFQGDTPLAKVQKLDTMFKDYLSKNSKIWRVESASLRIADMPGNAIVVSFWVKTKFIHWDEAGKWLSARYDLYQWIRDATTELEMSYLQAPLPVILSGKDADAAAASSEKLINI